MSTQNNKKEVHGFNKAVTMIGDEETLCIIHTLKKNELRFCELQRAMGGANPVTLTNRLKKLEKEGLVKRKEETLNKLSVVYELTEKGRAVVPIVNAIGRFAEMFYT